MTSQEQLNQVLSTFPSHADIQNIAEAQRSGEYWILITRMDGPSLATISKIQRQYYSISPGDDFGHKIFTFDEGITFADLLDVRKDIGEPPMMITRARKSRMTEEQLLSAFMPDPTKQTPAPREISMYCFILESDMKAWRWIDNLKNGSRKLY